jgi:DNA mismatch repair protein MutS
VSPNRPVPLGPFESILSPPGAAPGAAAPADPEALRDLNLDQVFAAVAAESRDHDIGEFFRAPLADLDSVTYRQEVARDLEQAAAIRAVRDFSEGMHRMRALTSLAAKLECVPERQRRLLGAAHAYCEAVRGLADGLATVELRSRGMLALRAWLGGYLASPAFRDLWEALSAVLAALGAVRYTVLIDGLTVAVRPYGGEPDYSAEVEATFAKFRRAPARDYRVKLVDAGRLNHVETQILERVARLNPEPFSALTAFCAAHETYLDERVVRFDREVQFYVAYLRVIAPLRAAGLPFCYPLVSADPQATAVRDAFDLALAVALLARNETPVRNDLTLGTGERIVVVTGQNHGGKTTFARMIGQLHYLAGLGLSVPGTEARLSLVDRVFVHFERVEDIRNLRGKLYDDLVRIRRILDTATEDSLVILNEVFASTTIADAIDLSRKVLARISRRGCLAFCVTFLDELASFDEKTVSVVGSVDTADPSRRTFKFERRPADGLAYALAIAEKYRVTQDWLLRRIRP